MTQHKIYLTDLIAWKIQQRILYAACSKGQKKLFCDLHGNYEVYKKGELILETDLGFKAVEKYNEL